LTSFAQSELSRMNFLQRFPALQTECLRSCSNQTAERTHSLCGELPRVALRGEQFSQRLPDEPGQPTNPKKQSRHTGPHGRIHHDTSTPDHAEQDCSLRLPLQLDQRCVPGHKGLHQSEQFRPAIAFHFNDHKTRDEHPVSLSGPLS
jgi:hypothetical protein